MIRSAFIRPVAARRCLTSIKNDTKNINFIATRSLSSINSTSNKSPSCYHQYAPLNQLARHLNNNLNTPATRRLALRSTSSSTSNKDTKSQSTDGNNTNPEGGGEPTSQEIVLTPGEKVVAGTRLFFWGGALTFASICAYYIGKELLPTKMSPNTIFDKASTKIHNNDEVNRRFGHNFKTYGRDHGGHREGRRNFIEHTEYTDPDDNSKRVRVRFNLEGQYGNAFVFAEVSKEMKSGEFVYILVQDKRNGAVITVEDNRSALLAKRLAGGSSEGQDVFANLLGGGKK